MSNRIRRALIILFVSFSIQQCQVIASSAAGQETLIGLKGKDFVLLGADSSASSSITVTSSSMDKITVLANPFPFHKDDDTDNDVVDDNNNDGYTSFQKQYHQHQPVIAVASVGEKADCERIAGQLAMQVTQMEYESGLGSDVCHIMLQRDNNDNDNNIRRRHHMGRAVTNKITGGLNAETVAYLARDRIAKNMRTRNRLAVCLLIGGMVPKTFIDSINIQEKTEKEEISHVAFADDIQAQVQAATSSYLTIMEQTTGSEVIVNDRIILSDLQGEDDNDDNYEPKLFWLDEYGSLLAVEYGAHGLGSNFILSILDRHYHVDMTREEGIQLLKDCFEQLRSRYIINSPNPPCIKCIDSHGCQKC